MIKILLIIGSGSFIGGVARFLTSRYVQAQVSTAFPLGTFTVNMIGCFFIGILYGLTERNQLLNNELRLFLTVGFCGGFTTFSSFTNENMLLLKDGNFFYFALYAGLSVFAGLMASWGGSLITRFF
jgi:CrcB protein